MDPAPRRFSQLTTDAELGVPVPFACTSHQYGERDDPPDSVRRLDGRRVTQCALSRVCGVCGATLGRPITFLGSRAEAARNAFHFPPCHLECARSLHDAVRGLDAAVLGQDTAIETWVLATTSSFEFARPGRDDEDRRPTFGPNEILSVVD